MNASALAIERATWVMLLKQELKEEGYALHEHLNDYKSILIVTHAQLPGWWIRLSVCSAHRARNRVELNGNVFSHSCNSATRRKLVEALKLDRENYSAATVTLSAQEKEAAAWALLQDEELAGLDELKGVDVRIIRSGPYRRQYCVTMQPGNPLEHLTLEQFKVLHAFLQSLV